MFKVKMDCNNLFGEVPELEKFLSGAPRNAAALQVTFSALTIKDAFDDWYSNCDFICKNQPELFVDEKGVLYMDGYELCPVEEVVHAECSENYILLFCSECIYLISPLITEEENRCCIQSVEVYSMVDSRRRINNLE